MTFTVIFFSIFLTSFSQFGTLPPTIRDSLLFNPKPIFTFNQSVLVLDSSSNDMKRAWAGGFRSPQFSEIDINGDGIKDLFVFDRYDNSISLFENNNGIYIYKPDYDYYFPALSQWVLLRDYNCDGKNDIFAASIGGVQVWENTTLSGGQLSFSLINSYLVGTDGPLSVFQGDIPDISDIDNDGDLDILAFGNTGVYVNYYKNKAIENGSGCDLDYEIYTQCWGHFREGGSSSSITLDDNCGGNRPSNNNISTTPEDIMHIGSTLLAIDNDGDSDKDLLVGDIASDNLTLLHNGGTVNDALIDSVDTKFPIINPVDMYTYVAGFLIDTDNDGDKDLIVSPQDGAPSGGKNYDQNLHYENVSNNNIPDFQFVKNNFISDQMIEVGGGANPKLYDFDFDGDLDLLVSNFAFRASPSDVESKILLYENIGNSSLASFKLINNNFANLKTTTTNEFSKILTFGDLDNDGDDDMIIGILNGQLRYYENTAGANQIADYTLFIDVLLGEKYQDIDVGSNASPELVDFNRDGKLDLLVGANNGKIYYFKNIGTPTSPEFNAQTSDTVGNINLKSAFEGGYTTPRITDLNKNNNYDLVVGSVDGLIQIYMDIEDYLNIDDTYIPEINTYFNSVSENFTNLQFDKRTVPTLGDLNNDGFPEMLVGIYRGGVHFLQNSSDSTLIPNSIIERKYKRIKIYPNPNNGDFNINLPNDFTNYNITIVNIIGQKCSFDSEKSNNGVMIRLTNQKKGLYYIIIHKDNELIYKSKIVLLK